VQYLQSSCGFALATRKGEVVKKTPINNLPTLYLRLMLKMGELPMHFFDLRNLTIKAIPTLFTRVLT
jgi:hypothetical protein